MKKLFMTTLALYSSLSLAGLDKGVRNATLSVNKAFNMQKLDQVGSTIKNKRTGEILRHHCIEREENKDCKELIHILSTENKDLILHDRKHSEIKQNVSFIKYRLDMSFRQSTLNFTDFDSNYRRSAGDFTGYIGGSCIYEPNTCALLVLLPLTIAADLVMLPIDITINESQRLNVRRRAKKFIQHLESDNEMIEMNNRSFKSLLRGLSQF
jgi:hypothetical protein